MTDDRLEPGPGSSQSPSTKQPGAGAGDTGDVGGLKTGDCREPGAWRVRRLS
jgi:hypothetical protein